MTLPGTGSFFVRIVGMLVLALGLGAAQANPVLFGTWSGLVDGEPLVVEFGENANGKVNGEPMRWQSSGSMLFLEQQGHVQTYHWQVQAGKLRIAGGDLDRPATLTRGTKAADAAKAKQAKARASGASAGQELVGKWCQVSTFTANQGGSQRSACFELRPDGSYVYQYEGSMSAAAPGVRGGTASQSSDAGRWSVQGGRLVAQSRSGKVSSYRLEKRNHPKNKRDPMICLDGECYVTFYNKPPW